MASISDFMETYQRDYDQYAIIEKQVETLCKKLLKAQNIKFAWQSRVKEPLSLETKLRNRSSKYENDVQNIDDIKDLVAGRILLTRWRDFGLVERILNENFHISERSQHPKEGQEAASRESRFRGYGGLHFYLTRRVPHVELYSQLIIEIQVMSLAMSSWSELEHDFSYKKLNGKITKDVLLVLEATKGLANSQEVLLQLFENLLDSNIKSPRLQQPCDNPDPSLIIADLIHEHRETIQSKLRSQIEEEHKCLQTFRTSDYEKHKARNPDRVEGTCQWFLQHRHFSLWQESKESSLLWVSADPGCGKSVLSKSLIDGELRSNHSRTTCYFFFKDDNVDQKSVTTALSALLHQLFSQKNALLKHAIQEYNKNGSQLSQLFDMQWNILINAAADPEAGEILCIFDALDECQDRERERLIAVLNHFQCDFACRNKTKSSLKFLVTSRPYFHIERRFKDLTLKFPTIRLAGEDESEAISQEINLVIKEKVQRLGIDLELSSKAQSTLANELSKIEHRTYLWLYLIFDIIENSLTHTSEGLREIIQKLPGTVDDAYNAILERSTDKSLAKKLLHIVVSAVNPLTLREMNVALMIQESDTSYEDLDLEPEKSFKVKVKNLCGLFVSVVDSRIYLLHQTAKEFLVSENDRVEAPNRAEIGNWKYSLEFRESNSILARACVFYLLFDVFKIVPFFIGDKYEGRYKSLRFANYRHDRRKNVYTDKHYFLQYAASHWAFHVREAKVKDENLQTQIISKLCNVQSGQFRTWYKIYSWPAYEDVLESTTKLMMASSFGLESTMLLLLKEGASVDATDNDELTALHYAVKFGGEGAMQLLLRNGANIETKNSLGKTALHRAISQGNYENMQLLLQEGADTEARDNHGETALHKAARSGNFQIVQLLLQKGADIEARDIDEETALQKAAKIGKFQNVQLLLQKGADIEARDKYKKTALHKAASFERFQIVQLLLQKSADIEARDIDEETALQKAAKFGKFQIVQLLLQKGADIEARNIHEETALHEAAKVGDPLIVQLLLQQSADIEARDKHKKTALHRAASFGRFQIVQLLLQKGADIEARDIDEETALQKAAKIGKFQNVQLLLQKGADIEARDNHEETALQKATNSENDEIVQLLLQNGANIETKDQQGITLLDRAIKNKVAESTLQLLQSAQGSAKSFSPPSKRRKKE